ASPSPEVCVRMWLIVRLAGLPEGVFSWANSGRYFDTGSATFNMPSSCSMRIAVAVIGCVIEATQTSELGIIGLFVAKSAKRVVRSVANRAFAGTGGRELGLKGRGRGVAAGMGRSRFPPRGAGGGRAPLRPKGGECVAYALFGSGRGGRNGLAKFRERGALLG